MLFIWVRVTSLKKQSELQVALSLDNFVWFRIEKVEWTYGKSLWKEWITCRGVDLGLFTIYSHDFHPLFVQHKLDSLDVLRVPLKVFHLKLCCWPGIGRYTVRIHVLTKTTGQRGDDRKSLTVLGCQPFQILQISGRDGVENPIEIQIAWRWPISYKRIRAFQDLWVPFPR